MFLFLSIESIIAAKREQQNQALSTAVRYSEETHGACIRATASEIVRRIQAGEWTASQVLEAYIVRAALVQRYTNCVTEVLFDDAREQANALDEAFEKERKIKGPLHGVPISFKDQFEIAGYDASIGFSRWAHEPCKTDAPLVAQYRSLGAIPFIKTNVPQTMLAFECANPLWGTSLNPWSANYTCGGSSGGEGAILAGDGAAIGVGSDVGGSLRIPASYCRIYSLKPGWGRVNGLGARSPTSGFEAIRTVMGPMGRCVSDIELACRGIFSQPNPYNELPPVPYRDVTVEKSLKFGYYMNDGFIKASPANKWAVLETVDALRREGHECIEFSIPDPVRAMELLVMLTSADRYQTMLSHLGPDRQENSLFLVTLGPRLFGFIRAIASWLMEKVLGDPQFARLVRGSKGKSVEEFYQVVTQRDEYRREFYKHVWHKYQFDGIVAPVQALPTIPHGGCSNLSPLAAATVLYNIVDSPAGVIPVTRVDPAVDQLTPEWLNHNAGDVNSRVLEFLLYRTRRSVYDPVAMRGIPVGVQIVGRSWEDEKVVEMMKIVDKALGERDFGPGAWNYDRFMR